MKTKAKFGGQNVNRNEIKMWNIPKVRFLSYCGWYYVKYVHNLKRSSSSTPRTYVSYFLFSFVTCDI